MDGCCPQQHAETNKGEDFLSSNSEKGTVSYFYIKNIFAIRKV
jgi:hypothetical protein